MPKRDESLPQAGESVRWWRYDGGSEPTMHEGVIWSEAPAFRGMRAWWVQADGETRYVARTSRLYTTGAVVAGKWHRDSGDVIEVDELFEEVHPQSKMVTSLSKAQEKFKKKHHVTHQGQTDFDAFKKLCDGL